MAAGSYIPKANAWGDGYFSRYWSASDPLGSTTPEGDSAIQVVAGGTYTADLRLPLRTPGAVIVSGKIVDKVGAAVPGMPVRMSECFEWFCSGSALTYSQEDGSFAFTALDGWAYQVVAYDDGHFASYFSWRGELPVC